MPEGDTIHRAARSLARALNGKRVVRVQGSVFAVVRAKLEGHRVVGVEARGKHLAMRFDDGRVLHSHMRMRGSWHIYRAGERWRGPEHEVRVALEVEPLGGDEAVVAVCFSAPLVQLESAGAHEASVASLGPDVVAPAFEAGDAREAVANMRAAGARPIGEVLLDQRALAGIGNIYKSEVLFAERVSPLAPAGDLPEATLAALVARARLLMRRSVASQSGARVTTGGLAGSRHAVYRRGGLPCLRCGGSIARIVQGAQRRSTYFCPSCQPLPPNSTRTP